MPRCRGAGRAPLGTLLGRCPLWRRSGSPRHTFKVSGCPPRSPALPRSLFRSIPKRHRPRRGLARGGPSRNHPMRLLRDTSGFAGRAPLGALCVGGAQTCSAGPGWCRWASRCCRGWCRPRPRPRRANSSAPQRPGPPGALGGPGNPAGGQPPRRASCVGRWESESSDRPSARPPDRSSDRPSDHPHTGPECATDRPQIGPGSLPVAPGPTSDRPRAARATSSRHRVGI